MDLNSKKTVYMLFFFFVFFQAKDGIRGLVRSRGLGDVYKRQGQDSDFRWRTASCLHTEARYASKIRPGKGPAFA